MTGDGACAGIRPALGVYVLGAAEPAERALVRLHLARCRDCREELAGLAGLPGLLRRVPAAEAEKLFAAEAEGDSHVDSLPVTALPQLLVRAARARRARRWLAVAVTAVAAVIAAGGEIVLGAHHILLAEGGLITLLLRVSHVRNLTFCKCAT